MHVASPRRSPNWSSKQAIERQRQFVCFKLSLERRVVTRAYFASLATMRVGYWSVPRDLPSPPPLGRAPLVLRRPQAVRGIWTFTWRPRLLSAWLLHGRHPRHLRGPRRCVGVGPDESDSEYVFPRRGESASRGCLRRLRSGYQAAVHGWPWPPNPGRFRE